MSNIRNTYKIKRLAFLLLCIVAAGSLLVSCMSTPSSTSAATTASTTSTTTTATTTAATTATTATTSPTTEATQASRPAETTLTLLLEGNEQKVAAKLFMSDLGYSMYLETNSYEYSVTDSQIDESLKADRFTPAEVLEDKPDMFLEIGHLDNITREGALVKIQNQLQARFPTLAQEGDIGVGVNKLDALVLHGINGSDWDSEAFTSAVFSDGGDGVYYYIIIYFFEASEGYASRFNQYLDTFRIE